MTAVDGPLGATPLSDGSTRFLVWAPRARRVEVRLTAPRARVEPLQALERGYHAAVLQQVPAGARYLFRLDGERERPDPASRLQPDGVHGPSQVLETSGPTPSGAWHGLPLEQYVLYELHVGAFSAAGGFDGVLPYLGELRELGVTAVELMPVAQFPGERNWGYDGVYPFAVQASYGGPAGLRRLVAACHQNGLAAVLDVVYNHLGPEGNYLGEYGPYFSDRHRTPWGEALNFDGADSDEVRRYFVENALYWIGDLGFDALRLDAVHGIFDASARPFLAELAQAVHDRGSTLGRPAFVIAESALNDNRVVRPEAEGGFGHDAQWSDDFHHACHVLLTREREGYYQDFSGLQDLATAFRDGFVYSGQYSAYRRRRHGNSSRRIPARRLVVFAQNHDQVGNRLGGERLSQLVPFEGLKLSAACVLLSPFLPLLFMGEEYGERAPFPYFVSHGDPDLVEAVRRGRRDEFAAFGWQREPPDPQSEATFLSARLQRGAGREAEASALRAFYREALRLRREEPALARPSKRRLEATPVGEQVLLVRRWSDERQAALLLHFGREPASAPLRLPDGRWLKRLDSADPAWGGPGSGLPDAFEVAGEPVTLRLPPLCAVLLSAEGEGTAPPDGRPRVSSPRWLS